MTNRRGICTAGRMKLLIGSVSVAVWLPAPLQAQESTARAVPCRDLPCAVQVDWTRAGGIGSQVPDRRYGNPTLLEERVRARLSERGFARHGGTGEQGLRFLLVPAMGSAMCDEVAGTATDRSCRAILEVEARADGPDELRRGVDIPSRIRNVCSSDRRMPVDRLGDFLGDWIIYALEGKSKGERRPVARC